MLDQLRAWIDAIFKPPITFLNTVIDYLAELSVVTAQGINLNNYLFVLGDLPAAWQMAVKSLFVSIVAIGFVFIVRSLMRVYYALKEGVHWW